MPRKRPPPDWNQDSVSILPRCRLANHAVKEIQQHLGLGRTRAFTRVLEAEMSRYLAGKGQAGQLRVTRSVALNQLISDLENLKEQTTTFSVEFFNGLPNGIHKSLHDISRGSAGKVLTAFPDVLKEVCSHIRRSKNPYHAETAQLCLNLAGKLESCEQFGTGFVRVLRTQFPLKIPVTQPSDSKAWLLCILTSLNRAALQRHTEENKKGGPEFPRTLFLLLKKLAAQYKAILKMDFTHSPTKNDEYVQIASKGASLALMIVTPENWIVSEEYKARLPKITKNKLATLLRPVVKGGKKGPRPDQRNKSQPRVATSQAE